MQKEAEQSWGNETFLLNMKDDYKWYHMTTVKVFYVNTFKRSRERLLSDNRRVKVLMYEIIYKVMVSLVSFLTNKYCESVYFSESNLLRSSFFLPFTQLLPDFRVGETGAWDDLPEVHTNSSVSTYVVTKLLPFTVYSFRILAVNRLGVSLPSKESYYICTLREGKLDSEIFYNSLEHQIRVIYPTNWLTIINK